MKISFAYKLLSVLSLIAGFGGVVFVMLGIVGSFADSRFRGDIFGAAFWLFATAVLFHVVCDIGARLYRMEHWLLRVKPPFEEDKW